MIIRNKKLFALGLPIILLVFAADQVWSVIAERSAHGLSQSAMQISVKAETGATGHNTIGIDEQSLGAGGGERFLHFATLQQWDYTVDHKVPCPSVIQGLSGKKFESVGFMYPLQTGEQIKVFCLLRSTQTCCYGPRPQFNQYILVEMKEPVKFRRLTPVMVTGKFFVDPKPADGYVYRMEGESLTPVGGDEPDVNPQQAAMKAKLPLFDFSLLNGIAQSKAVSNVLGMVSGKRVIVAGYCVSRSSAQPPRIILGKVWWDGVSQGVRPSIYNAIAVFPADMQQVPPIWKPFQVFTGTLHVTTDPSQWRKDGIVQLRDAELGVPGVTKSFGLARTGPFIPLSAKVVILAIFLLLTLELKGKSPEVKQA